MKIYRAKHLTFDNGRVGDFSLPRTMGYWETRQSAERAVDQDIERRSVNSSPYDRTGIADYVVTEIEVNK